MTLPLRHRLPNPPALFVGREAEVEQLRAALSRAPLAVVFGPGGMGKSSLVSATLLRHFPDAVACVVSIGLSAALPDGLAAQVARPLLAATGSRGDPLLATLVDVAEEHALWVAVDDLHHADAAQANELLGLLARYARRSRWTFTTRRRPSIDELAGQLVTVGPIADSAARELARHLAGDLEAAELTRVVRRAAGSPWRLRQLCFHGVARPGERSDLLAGLAADGRACLEVLALVEQPLPTELLCRVCGATPAALRDLEDRGLARQRGEGWQLHDVARSDLEDHAQSPARTELLGRLRSVLATEPDSSCVIESIRLALAVGDRAGARETLERSGQALLAQGYSAELWSLLRGETSPELGAWVTRCALDVGARALDVPSPPAGDASAPDQLAWAMVCLRRGKTDVAVAVAMRVVDDAAADPGVRSDAVILAARGLLATGDAGRACHLLASWPGDDGERGTVRAALLADALISSGDRTGAARLADDLTAKLPRLSGSARLETIRFLTRSLFELGRLRDLERALLGAPSDVVPIGRDLGRGLLYQRACLAADRGDLREAKALCDRLEPYLLEGIALRDGIAMVEHYIRFAIGDLDGLDAGLEALHSALEEPRIRGWLLGLRYRWAIACGVAVSAQTGDAVDALAPGDATSAIAAMARAEHAARTGANLPVPAAPLEAPEASTTEARARAVRALLDGELDRARDHAARAVQIAHRSGHGICEAEARLVVCDVLAVAGDRDALVREAGILAELAVRMGSPRFEREARFHLLDSGGDPESVFALATGRTAPAAARRVRSLIGAPAELDRVDQAVVGSMAARWPWRAAVRGADRPPDLWWFIDVDRGQIWRAGKGALELGRRALLVRLLAAIAARDCFAGKEELLAAVWDVQDYNPLRHDNRIKIAIRKLRVALGEDAATPRLLLTREAGYALGGWPIVRIGT